MGWFTLAGIVAVLVAGATTAVAGHAAGEREAIVDLRTKTLGLAQLRIQPVVTDALLAGNITAVGDVGAAVRHYVLGPSVVRVKIWNKDDTIVFSDESRLIGTHLSPSPEALAAIRSNVVRSKISDPSRPENRFERSQGKLLEVDLVIHAPNGQPLRLEVYYRYNAVTTAGTHVWNRFAPLALGALGAVTFVLVVVGSLLARRLGRRTAEPATDRSAEVAARLDELVLAPVAEPDPATALVDALSHLVARTNGGGVATTLDTDNVRNSIPPAVAEMFFRATQEALRNLPAHENATPVTVRVSDRDHVATLDVVDDSGTGNAHVNLVALTDLVADAGGRLLIDAPDNGGTRVHVEVPLR